MKKLLLLLSLVAIVAYSCKDDDDKNESANIYYDYFPVNVGHQAIYDVELITKDEFSGNEDTAYYQVKEVIESIFTDNQGRPTQRIERYRRDTPQDPWVISDVWTSNISATRAEKKEDNVTYVKMVFPINLGGTWNGNLLNTFDARDYEYTGVHTAEVVGGQTFDSVLTVLQIDDDTFISKEYSVEKYAYGIGLIYRQNDTIAKNYTNPNLPGVSGQRLYKETIVSWSN